MSRNPNDMPPWQWLNESDDLNRDTLILFDVEKINRLVDLMGDKAKPWALKRGLQSTVRHYLAARLFASRRTPGKAEWQRIVRFGEAAKAYAKALEGLAANGGADQRIILDLAFIPEGRAQAGDNLFKVMLEQGGPGSPLRKLQQLVEATADAADRLAIEPFEANADDSAAAYHDLVAQIATPDDKRRIEAFCLLEATKAFYRVWRMNSRKPFNAGKYYADIGEFVGDAISATHLVMTTLDPLITHRRVATAIRDLNATVNGYKN